MPSSLQGSKPLLFHLPLEVRLMIYRHAWKVDPKPHTIRSTRQLMTSYLEQQLIAIGRLGAICQQMRSEAFDEYFHHAQAYLRWDHNGSGSRTRHNRSYKELILSSPLLMAHLRHVSFHWADGDVHKKNEVSPIEALYWLHCLKQLQTLQFVVPPGYEWRWAFARNYKQKQVIMSLSNLRGLEKATVKLDGPEDLISPSDNRCLVRQFMKTFEGIVTLPKDAKPPCQTIKEHLGCLNPRWITTRSSRI